MTNCLKIITILSVFLTLTVSAHELKHYQMPGSTVHEVNSKVVGQLYELAVSVPSSYSENTAQTYPVIYVMDGQWNFSIVRDITGKLNYDGVMPEVIIVGVTWGGEGADPGVLRGRDYTPSAIPQIPNSGGADNFLTALETELIPFIEQHYRNNEERIVTGSSLGGLIVTYALLEKPRLFNKYISSAGAFQVFSDDFLNKKLLKLANSKLHKNTRIFIGCGTLDQCENHNTNMVKELKALNLPDLDVKLQLAEGLGHTGVEPLSYTYGLKMAFKRPFFAISESTLNSYTGTYTGDNGFSVKVSAEKNGFLTQQNNGSETHWLAESDTKFYADGANLTFEISPKKNGKHSVSVNAQGNIFNLTRDN